jgi:hypothetical protein
MSDNNQNITSEAVQQDYQKSFLPNVHRVGRATMAISFLLVFIPVLFFYFIIGHKLPITSYANVVVAVASIGIGMWLTEPLAYWPVLGSAGTYIGYLSGNVGGMRFPVALSVQSAMNADINTPRGQVATIIGIVASVYTNLVILLVIVLAGSWLLSVLPAAVLAAFGFVMPCLMGCMLMMRFGSGKEGVAKAVLGSAPYLITAILCKVLITYVLHSLAAFGTAIAVGTTVLVAYIMFKVRTSKA